MANMDGITLADAIIARLNALILDESVRKDLLQFILMRSPCSMPTVEHPTIQADGDTSPPTVGFMGILNGIVGVVSDGPRKGWGLIGAVIDDDGQLKAFDRT